MLSTSENLLVIFYENLKRNPLKEIRKMLHFYKFPIDEGRLKCLQTHLEGKAKRKHQVYNS